MRIVKKQVLDCIGMLQAYKIFIACKLPEGLIFDLAPIGRRLSRIVKDFEAAKQVVIKDLAGSDKKIPDEKMAEFTERVKVLVEKEVDLKLPLPISRDRLKGVIFDGAAFTDLLDLFDFPED